MNEYKIVTRCGSRQFLVYAFTYKEACDKLRNVLEWYYRIQYDWKLVGGKNE